MRTRQFIAKKLNVAAATVWDAVSGIGRLDVWFPIIETCRIDGQGPGAVRRMTLVAAMLLCGAAAFGAMGASASAAPASSSPIKIAVFRFELQDVTPAATPVGTPAANDDSVQRALQRATQAARKELAGSGRYRIVSVNGVDAKPVEDQMLRNCNGCEAAIARKLGAQQSMLGIVRRATQTDYYIMVVIRNAKTGKVLNVQAANFAGGEEGWASGAQVLIRYQVLPR